MAASGGEFNPVQIDPRVRHVELAISGLLRVGVSASLLIVVCGLVLMFVHHPSYMATPAELQRLTQPGAAFPHTLSEVAAGLAHLRGQAVVIVGLLVLLVTPVARVGVSIIAFAYQRDRAFVVLTSAVFLLLLLSFVLGRVDG